MHLAKKKAEECKCKLCGATRGEVVLHDSAGSKTTGKNLSCTGNERIEAETPRRLPTCFGSCSKLAAAALVRSHLGVPCCCCTQHSLQGADKVKLLDARQRHREKGEATGWQGDTYIIQRWHSPHYLPRWSRKLSMHIVRAFLDVNGGQVGRGQGRIAIMALPLIQ